MITDEVGRPPRPDLRDPCAERTVVGDRLRESTAGAARGGAAGADLDVFLTGTVFMDMIFTGLAGLPPPGTELFADGLGSAPGGVANLAVAMSRLGLRVGLAAAFGDDMFAAYLWRTLAEQEGVDLSLSRRFPGWPTPVTVSLAYDSDRGMVTYHRPREAGPHRRGHDLTHDLTRDVPLARTCFVDLDTDPPDWARRLRAAGTIVFGDVGWDPTETWSGRVLERLSAVDVFLPNAVEAMAYTRTGTPGDALAALSDRVPVVAVKCGGEGAIAVDGYTGETARAPALPVTALDPTGAGDVFAAAFVFGTLASWPLADRLKFANLCAGLSVRHHSGSLGAPCWGEIAAFGESGELGPDVLAQYGFVVPFIPAASAAHTATRATPTVGYGNGER